MQVMISCGVCGNALIEEIYEILLKLDFRLNETSDILICDLFPHIRWSLIS